MGIGKVIKYKRHSILGLIGSYSLAVVLSVVPVKAFASWGAPVEIISGTWGSGNDEFGIRYEDTSDIFPKFTITSEGKIVVRDGINRRLKIYTATGNFEAIVPYRAGRHYTELTLADSYGFSGDFVGYGVGGANYFYRADQKLYINFSPTGQLIKTSITRPLELGVITVKPISESQYKITIKYPDKTYQMTTAGTFMRYAQDTKGFVYGVNDDSLWKFDQCGKQVGELLMPDNPMETVTSKTGKSLALPVQYGQPVIALNGDVYTWKKSMLKYSIVKWTWVDDPNVPRGPDAPSGLTAMPSLDGVYLTWKASPQDPGCVTTYEIYRATSAGGVGATIGTVSAGQLKYNDTTATAGTSYYYKIRAMSGSDPSAYTSEVSGKR